MRAIVLNDFGGVDQLVEQQLEQPVPAPGEVLINVKAISINPVDVKTRAGKGMAGRLREIKPLILGWDIAGVVVSTGAEVQEFKTGDEVFGMVNFPGHGQGYAEYVAAPAAHLALKPANISFEEAAAATLAALTAWQALKSADIKSGQRVFIHAAAGGVGHFAVQLAKRAGAYVIGTSSAGNRDFVLSLGADEHIDYRSERFEDTVRNIDFVLDAIGGDNIDRSLPMINRNGTIISIPSGLREEVTQKAKDRGIIGYFILVQSSGADMKSLARLLETGQLKSHVSKTFPLDRIGEAHLHIESGRTVGKVVIVV